jgi:tetratricopeptide (TPR) repeat protein
MFRNPDTLEKFSTILVGTSLAATGLDYGYGAVEALVAAGGLAAATGAKDPEAERVLIEFKRQMERSWRTWAQGSSHADADLPDRVVTEFELVLPYCVLTPAEVAGQGLDPEAIADAMLARAAKANADVYGDANPHNREAALHRAFLLSLVQNAYAHLIAQPRYFEIISPDLWRRLMAQIDRMENTGMRTEAKVNDLLARFDRMEQAQAARASGVTDAALIELAQRIAADVADAETAFRELENAVAIAIRVQDEGRAGSNLGDFIDTVLRRVAERSALGEHAAAVAEIDAALVREEAESRARQVRLLDAALEQDLLRRDPEAAARRIVRKVELALPEGGRLFGALRSASKAEYARGRNHLVQFHLEVAINILEKCKLYAKNADERGSVYNEIGNVFFALSKIERGISSLKRAEEAYKRALEEWSYDRTPKNWAGANNNLGNTKRHLAPRTECINLLTEALDCYEESLKVWSRSRSPLLWAMAKDNIGIVHASIGGREVSQGRLIEAIRAFQEALRVRRRAVSAREWATTQNNMGVALTAMAEREFSLDRIDEAIIAFHCALDVWNRDNLPNLWAMARVNLGTAYLLKGKWKNITDVIEKAIEIFISSLEVRRRDVVPLQWAAVQRRLGMAYFSLGELEVGVLRLEQSRLAFQANLDELSPENARLQRAVTMGLLGQAECKVAERTNDLELATQGLSKIRGAELQLSEGGHFFGAQRVAAEIPAAEAIVARLSR